MKSIFANIKTTLLAIIPLVLGLLTAMGWVDLEQQTALINGVDVVLNSTDSVINEVTMVIEIVTGIALLFARDGDVSSEASGILKD